MKITRIEIKKYKSIKEPIEINFYDNLPTVLIGKNGSGKTNILEALDTIAEVNSNYFGASSKLPLSYKVHITLSKNDIARLFPGKKIDENKCRFVACSGENCKINRIESEYLVPLLNSEICEILDLTDELKKALNTYLTHLKNRFRRFEVLFCGVWIFVLPSLPISLLSSLISLQNRQKCRFEPTLKKCSCNKALRVKNLILCGFRLRRDDLKLTRNDRKLTR